MVLCPVGGGGRGGGRGREVRVGSRGRRHGIDLKGRTAEDIKCGPEWKQCRSRLEIKRSRGNSEWK
jgi:hypothetical protein